MPQSRLKGLKGYREAAIGIVAAEQTASLLAATDDALQPNMTETAASAAMCSAIAASPAAAVFGSCCGVSAQDDLHSTADSGQVTVSGVAVSPRGAAFTLVAA